MVEEPRMPEQKESIKLSKMSKGYNWEIKVVAMSKPYILGETEIERLEDMDKKLKEKFGEN